MLATGLVAGIFLIATAVSGIWFGSLVDQLPQEAGDAGLGLDLLVIYVYRSSSTTDP